MKKETYLGIDVSPLNYKEIVASIQERIEADKQSFIVAVNPEKVMKAEKDSALKELINSATYQIPDGIGIVLASKLKKGNVISRVTGIEMMEELLQLAADKQYKIFLYGAKDEVISKAKSNIELKYPNISIVGYENGYVKDNEYLVKKINNSNAEILFVALGSPKQELWIKAHMDKLNVKVFQGVGGSFDVFSGQVKRAPSLFRNLGFEWFYRLITQPSRLKRQLALPKFLIKILSNR